MESMSKVFVAKPGQVAKWKEGILPTAANYGKAENSEGPMEPRPHRGFQTSVRSKIGMAR
jgi:hypothetical protein